jgi:hypothetical protein
VWNYYQRMNTTNAPSIRATRRPGGTWTNIYFAAADFVGELDLPAELHGEFDPEVVRLYKVNMLCDMFFWVDWYAHGAVEQAEELKRMAEQPHGNLVQHTKPYERSIRGWLDICRALRRLVLRCF